MGLKMAVNKKCVFDFIQMFSPSIKRTLMLSPSVKYSTLAEADRFEESTPKLKHVYKRINSFKDKTNFVNHLLDNNIIYNQDGLVVLNKPYGIGHTLPETSSMPALVNQTSFGENYYLSDVLPDIAAATGHSSLLLVKTPERYSSGVSLLAADENIKKKVKDNLITSRRRSELPSSYIVLSLGKPTSRERETKVAVKLDVSENNKRKLPIIVDEWSINDAKFRRVKTVQVYHKLLSTSEYVSLIQLKPSRTKSNFIRLYMATKLLSPILGDHLCGSKVKNVMGVNLVIDHWSSAAVQYQKIQQEILSQLHLNKKESLLVPSHIHLSSVTLYNYLGKNKNLKLIAPLPESFVWSCEQLGVQIPHHDTIMLSPI